MLFSLGSQSRWFSIMWLFHLVPTPYSYHLTRPSFRCLIPVACFYPIGRLLVTFRRLVPRGLAPIIYFSLLGLSLDAGIKLGVRFLSLGRCCLLLVSGPLAKWLLLSGFSSLSSSRLIPTTQSHHLVSTFCSRNSVPVSWFMSSTTLQTW